MNSFRLLPSNAINPFGITRNKSKCYDEFNDKKATNKNQQIKKEPIPITEVKERFLFIMMSGGDLLSHKVPLAVPLTLRGLASGFGMGPGVSLSLWPPKLY